MKKNLQKENASTLICAVLTLLVVSLIGASVLLNCTTRYNVSSKQVKAWKEALYAAEAGADFAFAEVRKIPLPAASGFTNSSFSSTFLADEWTASAAPTPGPAYVKSLSAFGQNNSLSAAVTVDNFCSPYSCSTTNGFNCYRIRSVGTATLLGLPRTGMDDRVNSTTRGDSLLRKIDFRYDHFLAAYGDGDGNHLSQQTVANPQVKRRIELIAVPQLAFTAAIRTDGFFDGPGSAGLVDSYNSVNGVYPGASIAANPVSPTDPNYKYYINSGSGNIADGTSSFTEYGPIYGNVTTNGGTITQKSNGTISGTVDNNVAFSVPPLVAPSTAGWTTSSATTLTVPAAASSTSQGTSADNPATYVYSSLPNPGLTINGQTVASGPNKGQPSETYVTIVVNGDVSSPITVAPGVNAKIYFTGNLNMKARDIVNNNVDGAAGVYNADGSASTDYSRAGHLQFYGISPTDGSTQTINIDSGSGSSVSVYATFYAPNADMTIKGAPDIYGAIVSHNFSANGNVGFHYDKQLGLTGIVVDYQIASYVEDVR